MIGLVNKQRYTSLTLRVNKISEYDESHILSLGQQASLPK
jgi:hypothetical protein